MSDQTRLPSMLVGLIGEGIQGSLTPTMHEGEAEASQAKPDAIEGEARKVSPQPNAQPSTQPSDKA